MAATAFPAPGRIVANLQLPIQAQSQLFVQPWEIDSGPEVIRDIAQSADRAGFWSVGVCDHTTVPERLASGMGTTWYDTVATLSWVAACTESVRLLSHVWVAPLHHPLQAAKAFATLDRLSGGRVVIGVGAGHVPEEFAALGVDFHRRGALLDEAIDTMKAALSNEFVDGMGIAPRPQQQPRPPIWVGGSSPAALRRAALRGDGWLPQGTRRAEMPAQIAQIQRIRDEARRDGPFVMGGIADWFYVGTPKWACGPVTSGSPEHLADVVADYRDIGVQHLMVHFRSRSAAEQCDQIEQFGRDVLRLV